MATIKSFTDLSQSKVLAKILPLESADRFYQYVLPKSGKIKHNPEIGNPVNALKWYNKGYTTSGKEPITLDEYCVPCWSLAALLELLPDVIKVEEECYTFSLIKNVIEYVGHDGNILYSAGGESLVDAAVKMFELIDK